MTIKDLLKYSITIGDLTDYIVYRFYIKHNYYYLEKNINPLHIERDGFYSSYTEIIPNRKTHLEDL